MFERWIKYTRLMNSTQEVESFINAANIAELQVQNDITLIRELGTPAGKPVFTIAAREAPQHFMAGAPELPGSSSGRSTGFTELQMKDAEAAAFEAGKKEGTAESKTKIDEAIAAHDAKQEEAAKNASDITEKEPAGDTAKTGEGAATPASTDADKSAASDAGKPAAGKSTKTTKQNA